MTRFLGIPSDVFGERLPDTAFTQYGGLLRANFNFDDTTQFLFSYSRNQQDGGRRYDQLLGGDGNLIADLRNLMTDLFYARLFKQNLGFFDNASFTFSYNGQREERVNQGGQGNPVGSDNQSTRAHQRLRLQLLRRQATRRTQHGPVGRRRLPRQDYRAGVYHRSGHRRGTPLRARAFPMARAIFPTASSPRMFSQRFPIACA